MPEDISTQRVFVMNDFSETLDSIGRDINVLQDTLNQVIVGQETLIAEILIAIFASGHILLEGLPGLGKTHIAKAVSAVLGLDLGRVQCTPDLLPADITGSEILVNESSRIEFRPGPVFANLLLVDEINRATPRTQAALLEAMQEQQVTYAGVRHPLPQPFRVIATQNPIELEGTFPLPEAQLDRFLFKINVSYPSSESLDRLLDTSLDSEPADELTPLITKNRTVEIQNTARQVLLAKPVKKAAIDMVLGTQPESESAAQVARGHIRYGASPRALQSLVRAARVRAMFAGRAQVDFEDLEAIALPVLSHRILLATHSELEGVTVPAVLHELLREWRSVHRK
jgi:MoxR-like ATPase